MTDQDILNLPEGGHLKYDLLEEIGQGTYGLVHKYKLTCQPKKLMYIFLVGQLNLPQERILLLRLLKTLKRTLRR